jgi:hypothetical protein
VKKYIRVITETPYDTITEYQEIEGDETEKALEGIASDIFYNSCNFGYKVVDESEVPEGER